MPTFRVLLKRTDIYTDSVYITTTSAEDATKEIQAVINEDGWSGVCGDDEGDYEECYTEIVGVEESNDDTE